MGGRKQRKWKKGETKVSCGTRGWEVRGTKEGKGTSDWGDGRNVCAPGRGWMLLEIRQANDRTVKLSATQAKFEMLKIYFAQDFSHKFLVSPVCFIGPHIRIKHLRCHLKKIFQEKVILAA